MKTPQFIERALLRLKLEAAHRANDRRFAVLSSQIAEAAPEKTVAPVIFFDVSTRLTGTRLNAAFAALSAWSLELKGGRVIHFVCQQGLAPCVFGTKETPCITILPAEHACGNPKPFSVSQRSFFRV
jgi:hypothetical protein